MTHELLNHLQDATEEAEERGKEIADAVVFPTTDDAINYILGWISGLEGVIAEIVEEIDRLSARLDEVERSSLEGNGDEEAASN